MQPKHIKFQPQLNPLPTLTTEPFQAELATLHGVHIEKFFVPGYSGANKFNVFPADKNGVQTSDDPILVAIEQSVYCTRVYCSNDCRAYKLNFYKLEFSQTTGKIMKKDPEIMIKKAYSNVCCCNTNKSFMEVSMNQLIGYVLSPNYYYGKGVEIFDDKSSLMYTLRAPYEFCCCQGSQSLLFEVKNAQGDQINEFKKLDDQYKCCQRVPTCFQVPFPPGATPEIKALFIAATVAIDYKYFDETRGHPKYNSRNSNY